MKKLILFLAAVCYTAMMQAEIVYNVPYIDENGVEQICEKATVVTSNDSQWTEGWYVLTSTMKNTSGGIECSGDVHLILGDGKEMIVSGESAKPGIKVSGGGNSLTIYGQKEQSGGLNATGGDFSAGIGGGTIDDGNNITINGGRVKAHSGNGGAGIGGGMYGCGSNIIINGGAVIATVSIMGASAIGSGRFAETQNQKNQATSLYQTGQKSWSLTEMT